MSQDMSRELPVARTSSLLSALLLCTGTVVRSSAGILFYDGFESNSIQQWKTDIQEEGGTVRLETVLRVTKSL